MSIMKFVIGAIELVAFLFIFKVSIKDLINIWKNR